MERDPNSLTDFEVLNAQMIGLAEQVKAMSAKIKSNTEHLSESHLERIDERLNALEREIIVLRMSLDTVTKSFNEHKASSDNDINDLYTKHQKLQEKEQELQGEINQVKLQISKSDEERAVKKNRVLTSFLYPILAGAMLMLIGYVFNSCQSQMFAINNQSYGPRSQHNDDRLRRNDVRQSPERRDKVEE